MQPRCSNQRNHALTLVEVLVIIILLALLAAIILPAHPRKYDWRKYTFCTNNLKQVGLAFLLWNRDHNDKYPMQVSITNGATMELVATGNVVATFQVMSNELSTPKALLCPADVSRDYATNFTTDFNNSRISYLVSVDADEKYSQRILSGDDNLETGGMPVKSGLLELSTNTPIAWSVARHNLAGNISLTDGSVQPTYWEPTNLFQQTGLSTNRLAIP